MTSRRLARITQAIREQVSISILSDIKDPRVNNVTVTGVEVSPDTRRAKIRVSILGDEKSQKLCLHGLNSARGFLQAKVAARIQTRQTPILIFELDQGVKMSMEVSRLIQESQSADDSGDGDKESSDSETPNDTAE